MEGELIRKRDGLINKGTILFLEYDENGQGRLLHPYPKVGFSCVVDSFKTFWLTTEIIEVISQTEFKTKNSHYKIEEI